MVFLRKRGRGALCYLKDLPQVLGDLGPFHSDALLLYIGSPSNFLNIINKIGNRRIIGAGGVSEITTHPSHPRDAPQLPLILHKHVLENPNHLTLTPKSPLYYIFKSWFE